MDLRRLTLDELQAKYEQVCIENKKLKQMMVQNEGLMTANLCLLKSEKLSNTRLLQAFRPISQTFALSIGSQEPSNIDEIVAMLDMMNK